MNRETLPAGQGVMSGTAGFWSWHKNGVRPGKGGKDMHTVDTFLKKLYGMTESDFADCAKHLMVGGGTRGGPVLVRGSIGGCENRDSGFQGVVKCM